MEKGREAGTEGATEVTGYTGNCRANPPEAESTDEATVEGTTEATPEEIEEATDGHPRSNPEAKEVETEEATDGTPHPGTTDESRPITVVPEPDDATAEGTVPDDETTTGRPNKDRKNGTNESPSHDDPGVGDTGLHTCRR